MGICDCCGVEGDDIGVKTFQRLKYDPEHPEKWKPGDLCEICATTYGASAVMAEPATLRPFTFRDAVQIAWGVVRVLRAAKPESAVPNETGE